MKKFLTMLAVVMMLTPIQSASAGVDEGIQAYKDDDYITAITELRPAAQQGNAKAQYYLGLMYWRGSFLIPQDNAEAYMWFYLAAEQGHEGAKKARDILEEDLPPNEVEKAKLLARAISS